MLKKFSKKTLLIVGAIIIVVAGSGLRITTSHICRRRQQMNPIFELPLYGKAIWLFTPADPVS